MIQEKQDIEQFFKNNIHLKQFLDGADGLADQRIFHHIAETIKRLNYVLVSKSDLIVPPSLVSTDKQ